MTYKVYCLAILSLHHVFKEFASRTEAFFPTIFYKTQFCDKQAWLPPGLTLSSKVTIITGSNAGLGYESANHLLALNLTHMILAVRSIEMREGGKSTTRPVSTCKDRSMEA